MKYAGKQGGVWKSVANEIAEINPNGSKSIRFVPVEPSVNDTGGLSRIRKPS